MTGHHVCFRTTGGSSLFNRTFLTDLHTNVRKEIPNLHHISPYLFKILLSKGVPFHTHELSYIFSENVSKQIQ